MKARVLIPFRNKETKKEHKKKGAVIEVSEKRYNEIIKQGRFVEPVENEKPAKAETDTI